MRQKLREILTRVFVALIIFLIGVVIYKESDPYAYPGLENRILFVLVSSGIVLLYLYLDDEENRDRLSSVIMVTIGRLHESKFMRFCEGIWERSPLLIRTCVSKVLTVLYTYLHKMSGYMVKHDPKQVVSYAFLGLLLMVALQSVFPQPSLEWARTPLMIAAVVLGVVTFYFNKDKLDEIEDEVRQEEIEGKKREMEFAGKYPRINRVWGVRWIAKGMYKEGWWYSGILLLLVLVGFWLRFYNLDSLSPFVDEYYHLIGAKRFMAEDMFNYPRAMFLTYIIGFLFKLNGETSLLLARFPSVIFGTMSIIAIYFLAKHINKKVGLISSYLLVFSPLSVSLSRATREYQAYFLFILLFLLCLIYFLQTYNLLNLKYLKKNRVNLLFMLLMLFVPILFYLYIEKVQMIIELYIISGIFIGIFYLPRFIKFKQENDLISKLYKSRFSIIVISLIVTLLVIYFSTKFLHDYNWLLRTGGFVKESKYENMFFNPDFSPNVGVYLQWFSGSSFSKLFASLLFILPIFFYYKNKHFVSSLLSFLTIYIAFVYFIDRYFASRYVYYAFPFYIIIYACSIYVLLNFKKILADNSKIYLVLIVVILAAFFNPITSINGIMDSNNGVPEPNGGFVHYDIPELIKYLDENNFTEEETLITANPMIFQYYYNYSFVTNSSEWPLKRFDYKDSKFVYDYGTLYHYYYSAAHLQKPTAAYLRECNDQVCNLDENKRMNEIIKKYEIGWIVVDKDRNRNWNKRGFPLKNYTVEDTWVEYIGSTSGYRGFDIYRWKSLQN